MIDTHCHLDSEPFGLDLEKVIEGAKQKGVARFVIPGADITDLSRAIKIAEEYPEVYFAAGIHPYHLDTFDLDLIENALSHPKCVAVGECGLDYFRLPSENVEEYKAFQKQCLIQQIELALKWDKPIILHIREASNDTADILKEYPTLRGVFHCFNADEILLQFSDRFFYGIGGVLTFKNARRLVEVLPKIPKERLLLETDSPYLTPHPYRGERNDPQYIPLIAQKVSEVLKISQEEIILQIRTNAQKLFNIFL